MAGAAAAAAGCAAAGGTDCSAVWQQKRNETGEKCVTGAGASMKDRSGSLGAHSNSNAASARSYDEDAALTNGAPALLVAVDIEAEADERTDVDIEAEADERTDKPAADAAAEAAGEGLGALAALAAVAVAVAGVAVAADVNSASKS